MRVTIEMKNDTEVQGILDEVMYPSMNCVLTDCVVTRTVLEFQSNELLGKSKSLQPIVQRATRSQLNVDRTFVHGSTIRFVHFPDRISVHKQLAFADKIAQSSKQLYERGVRKDKKKTKR
mgnify:CR=1 FL=1